MRMALFVRTITFTLAVAVMPSLGGQTSQVKSQSISKKEESPANSQSAEATPFPVDELRARVAELMGRDQRDRAKQRRAELVRTREKTAERRTKLRRSSEIR